MADRTGKHLLIWMHLVKEGGRWSVAEIAEAIRMKPVAVNNALYRMFEQQMVDRRQRKDGYERVSFGVTVKCKIPLGVTLSALEKLGVLRVAEVEDRL